MCGECVSDNRFEIIEAANKHILEATNISTSPDEMKVLDSFLFRCWQMGWLAKYDTKIEPIPFPNQYIDKFINGEMKWDDAMEKTIDEVNRLIMEYVEKHVDNLWERIK